MESVRPHLMFVYLPNLDYCSQKAGPHDKAVLKELEEVDREVGRIIEGVRGMGLEQETTFVVLSEYVFSQVERDIPLNRGGNACASE